MQYIEDVVNQARHASLDMKLMKIWKLSTRNIRNSFLGYNDEPFVVSTRGHRKYLFRLQCPTAMDSSFLFQDVVEIWMARASIE